MILFLVVVFIICLFIRFPIAYAIAVSCLVYILIKGIPLVILPLKMYSGIDVFVLLSIPGFILAGNLMNHGGITEKIIEFCNHFFGHVRGGLSLANIGASMLFAGISGTAVSDTASIGSVMIPAMKKEGYTVRLCLCCYRSILDGWAHYSSQRSDDHRCNPDWFIGGEIVFSRCYSGTFAWYWIYCGGLFSLKKAGS